ncbi:MAG: sulfite exporter TauE/SafE family protein [Chloroflexi bacterium]|nr:MAG: sulfite exporter TauE/SafE family protein [Chloroflexota bacterium]
MQTLIVVAIAGLAAQLVDGSLGMGYGLTSSTLLIFAGLSPAAASASVHLAEVGTTALSGVAHHRFGNVDWHAVRRIAIPGGVGAFLGATLLSSLSTESARPLASALLFTLGIYVLLRFLLGKAQVQRKGRPGIRFLAPLGLIGGFVDATGGGGWGPVTTPTLLADGRLAPNRVVGTVSASEFIVALSASVGFFTALGGEVVRLEFVAALLGGGLIAAPIAAYMVRHLNPRLLGVVVGGFICFTNARVLLSAAGISGDAFLLTYVVIVTAWMTAVAFVVRAIRRERSAEESRGLHSAD